MRLTGIFNQCIYTACGSWGRIKLPSYYTLQPAHICCLWHGKPGCVLLYYRLQPAYIAACSAVTNHSDVVRWYLQPVYICCLQPPADGERLGRDQPSTSVHMLLAASADWVYTIDRWPSTSVHMLLAAAKSTECWSYTDYYVYILTFSSVLHSPLRGCLLPRSRITDGKSPDYGADRGVKLRSLAVRADLFQLLLDDTVNVWQR